MDVVDILKAKGFTSIYNLFDGLEGFMSDHRLSPDQISELITEAPAYHMVDQETRIEILEHHPNP